MLGAVHKLCHPDCGDGALWHTMQTNKEAILGGVRLTSALALNLPASISEMITSEYLVKLYPMLM